MSESPKRLILFFTRGVSLQIWEQTGSLERELALYRRLLDYNYRISFVTFGGPSEFDFKDKLSGMDILCNQRAWPALLYEQRLSYAFPWTYMRGHLFKTNQLDGADLAFRSARLWRKPLIARSGYSMALNAEREHGADSLQAREARQLENEVYPSADRIVVTTNEIACDVRSRFPSRANHVRVIPNYVDTELFKPADDESSYDLLFIGRLSPEKNLLSLIEALRPMRLRCLFIGDGPMRDVVQTSVEQSGGRWTRLARVPNSELPGYMNRSRLFILPSLFEGHPKTLIEAMSAGMAVIGTNSLGIRTLIRDDDTGFLCETGPEAIRAAIEELLDQPERCARLGRQARNYVMEHFSLDRVVQLELALHDELLSRRKRA